MKEYEEKLQKCRETIQLAYGKPIPERSGIYVLYRQDEDTIKHAYAGQALHMLTRLAQHLNNYDQRIDISLKSRGLYNTETNVYGWRVHIIEYPEEELNYWEHHWIVYLANKGYQMYNIQSGGGAGRRNLVPAKAPKGYYDGLKQGYTNARRDVAKLFKANLKAEINGKDGVRKQNALAKFNDFINIGGDDEDGQ